MKKILLIIILCFFQANFLYSQLLELKIYEKDDIEDCKFSNENLNKSTCSTYNSKALLKYDNIENVDFVIDFMGGLEDVTVTFNVTTISKKRIQYDGKSIKSEGFHCTFIIEEDLIVEGKIYYDDQNYKIDIGKKKNDVKMWFYPYVAKKKNERIYRVSDYNNLNAFTALSDTNSLMEIWGNEAHDNTFNTTLGVDLSSPIFHGSYDWHSSIHGHFASNYVGYFLNDYPTYINAINSQFTSSNVQAEINYISSLIYILNFIIEQQYGMPWLLNYSTYLDNSIYNGVSNPLQSLTQYCYDSNYNFVKRNLTNLNRYYNSVDSGYYNYNWQLLNLYIYAEENNLTATMTYVTGQLNNYAASIDWDDVSEGDFFDPKTIALLLYTKVGLTSGVAWDKLIEAFNTSSTAVPYTDLSTEPAHKTGLVISKSWGYWLMYYHTGNIIYKDAFIDHINFVFQYLKSQQNEDPEIYFRALAHWIPNFGIFGLKLVEDYPENSLTVDSLEKNIYSDIHIYPTAVSDILNIDLNSEASNTELTIVDMKGSIVYKQAHVNVVNKINVSYFQSGVYVVNVKNENRQLNSRVIKF